ncbi:MAG: c-type cytochrome [Methylococcaceae bacterium]
MSSPVRLNIHRVLGGVLLFITIRSTHADTYLYRPDPTRIATTCEACHGKYGDGSGDIPALSSLGESVFVQKMIDFRSDRTRSTVMGRIAKAYQDSDFLPLARLFSRSGGKP